jgi:hypothetical protein
MLTSAQPTSKLEVVSGPACPGGSQVLGSAYPWIARRLLTDPSPDLRTALRRLLYTEEGRFRFDRLESLLRQVRVRVYPYGTVYRTGYLEGREGRLAEEPVPLLDCCDSTRSAPVRCTHPEWVAAVFNAVPCRTS